MNDLARKGKIFTIRVFASVLLLSLYIIVSYNIIIDNMEVGKLIQQIIRFGLTLLLMYLILKGKSWAIFALTVLSIISAIGALISLFGEFPLLGKGLFLTILLIHSLVIYHLNFSKSFKEYLIYLSSRQ